MAEAISYWLSFRLHDSDGYERTYDDRFKRLTAQVKAATSGMWWYETSAFFIFVSAETIDTIVKRVKQAIDDDVDLVIIRQMDSKVGRVVGDCTDEDIFKIAPYMKKA